MARIRLEEQWRSTGPRCRPRKGSESPPPRLRFGVGVKWSQYMNLAGRPGPPNRGQPTTVESQANDSPPRGRLWSPGRFRSSHFSLEVLSVCNAIAIRPSFIEPTFGTPASPVSPLALARGNTSSTQQRQHRTRKRKTKRAKRQRCHQEAAASRYCRPPVAKNPNTTGTATTAQAQLRLPPTPGVEKIHMPPPQASKRNLQKNQFSGGCVPARSALLG